MTEYALSCGELSAVVSTCGGCLLRFDTQVNGERVPLFRPYVSTTQRFNPVVCASYPMVPFGNRVRSHHFYFSGRRISFKPNQEWFPEYLHGDGWVNEWSVSHSDPNRIGMTFARDGDDVSPYGYVAEQTYALDDTSLTIKLKVTNTSEDPLSFGLGHHPHFAWRPGTFVKLGSEGKYWSEDTDKLPGTVVPMPDELDFTDFSEPPRQRFNNVLEDWSLHAEVQWRTEGISLTMTASEIFRFLMVFVKPPEGFAAGHPDFFCLEPMTHRAGGHEQSDGGLVVLAKNEFISGSIKFVIGNL